MDTWRPTKHLPGNLGCCLAPKSSPEGGNHCQGCERAFSGTQVSGASTSGSL